MSDDMQDMVARLEEAGYRVTPPKAKQPPVRCSICGGIDQDVFFNPDQYDLSGIDIDNVHESEWMTPIMVEVGSRGEEAWDFVVKWFCDYHDAAAIDGLMKLGYTTHHHGSTHPLADDVNCSYGCEHQSSPYHDEY